MKIVPTSALVAVLICSCSKTETVAVGFFTTNESKMEALSLELESRNIPYSIRQDGHIFVDGIYSAEFDEAKEAVDEIEGIEYPLSILFTDESAREEVINFLNARSVAFTEFEPPVGVIVEWYPTSGSKMADLSETLESMEGKFSVVRTMPSNH